MADKYMDLWKKLWGGNKEKEWSNLTHQEKGILLNGLMKASSYVEKLAKETEESKAKALEESARYHALIDKMPQAARYGIANMLAHSCKLWGASGVVLTRDDYTAQGKALHYSVNGNSRVIEFKDPNEPKEPNHDR